MKVYRDSLSENIKLVGTGILGGGGEANSKVHSLLIWWSLRTLEMNEEKDRSELPCFLDRKVMPFAYPWAGSTSLSEGCYKLSKRFRT